MALFSRWLPLKSWWASGVSAVTDLQFFCSAFSRSPHPRSVLSSNSANILVWASRVSDASSAPPSSWLGGFRSGEFIACSWYPTNFPRGASDLVQPEHESNVFTPTRGRLLFDAPFFHANCSVQQLEVKVETKTLDNVFLTAVVSVQYQVLREKVFEAFYSLTNPAMQVTGKSQCLSCAPFKGLLLRCAQEHFRSK